MYSVTRITDVLCIKMQVHTNLTTKTTTTTRCSHLCVVRENEQTIFGSYWNSVSTTTNCWHLLSHGMTDQINSGESDQFTSTDLASTLRAVHYHLAKVFLSCTRGHFQVKLHKHLNRTRLQDRRVVSFARSDHHVSDTNTGPQGTFHVSALRPATTPDPRVRNQCPPPRPQTWESFGLATLWCFTPVASCFFFSLMVPFQAHDNSTRQQCWERHDHACFDPDLIRCLVVLTFSLLPPSQVGSFHCRLGSNCILQSLMCSFTGHLQLSPLYQPQPATHCAWLCCPRLLVVAQLLTHLALTQPFMSTSTPSKIALHFPRC